MRGNAGELPPTITMAVWKRIHPLLAGLEDTIPASRFDQINDALMSVDQLTMIVQNLQETSKADVLSSEKRASGGAKGGRGHKREGSRQATDADIERALDAVDGKRARKRQKLIDSDAVLHLKDLGKQASERKIQEVKSKRNKAKKESPAEP